MADDSSVLMEIIYPVAVLLPSDILSHFINDATFKYPLFTLSDFVSLVYLRTTDRNKWSKQAAIMV